MSTHATSNVGKIIMTCKKKGVVRQFFGNLQRKKYIVELEVVSLKSE